MGGQLTEAFENETLKALAFDQLRAFIEAVVMTPENGVLVIELRGKLAATMLFLAAKRKEPRKLVLSRLCK